MAFPKKSLTIAIVARALPTLFQNLEQEENPLTIRLT
jgi:hypothetical protein